MLGKSDVFNVLAELASLGAVNREEPPPTDGEVESVEIDHGPPGPMLNDSRGLRLDTVSDRFGSAITELTAAKTAIDELLSVWRLADGVQPEKKLETPPSMPENAPRPSVETAQPVAPLPPPVNASPPPAKELESYQAARMAAIAKIRGEDERTRQRRASMQEEDNVPYVGQVRVRPPGQESEETTIGTLGSVSLTRLTGGPDGA
jgi:hypothetical protein